MKKPKNYEEGIQQLDQLLEQLADPSTPLDKAIKLYSDTASLVEFCTQTLEQARLEMETISVKLNGLTEKKSLNEAIEAREEAILA